MTRHGPGPDDNRRGAALLMALLISIAIAAMALGAIMLASSAQITTTLTAREATMQAAANGGLEIIRDSINRGTFDSLLPDSGFTTLALNVPVLDAFGNPLNGITRSLYVGRTGGRTGGAATAGQYGSNFASALSIVTDIRGDAAVRRLLMTQESWAKYAVAINNWSGSASYGCDESVFGPFFSNTGLILTSPCPSPGTLFRGPVSVVGTITNQAGGTFLAGVQTGASPIPWPTTASLTRMQDYAQNADAAGGDYDLTEPSKPANKPPALRIEFDTVDVDGDGQIEWNEGFMRVWVAATSSDSALDYATGRRWPYDQAGDVFPNTTYTADPNMVSRNCGADTTISAVNQFYTASQVWSLSGGSTAAVRNLLTLPSRRCFLGGDPHLFNSASDVTPDSTVTNSVTFPFGWWKKRRLGPAAGMTTARPLDASYLIPLGGNANFKGVIYVQGDVALSGRLRGRVTVVATGSIYLADDLLYQVAPGTECDAQGDMLGTISMKNVVIEDDNLQTPFRVNGTVYGGYDDTSDANYNMFLFAVGSGLNDGTGNWLGEGIVGPSFSTGSLYNVMTPALDASATAQHCGAGSDFGVNSCVRVTGGLAQSRVDDATNYPGYYGWAEAHTYDACGAVNPPPYFPTTGRYDANRYYEIDPVWLKQLTVASYFQILQSQ